MHPDLDFKTSFAMWLQKGYIPAMNKTAIVRARIEPALKTKAEKVLSDLGLNASDAINLLYRQVALHKALPFTLRTPNAATTKSLRASRHGHGVKRYRDVDVALKDLGM